MRASVRKIFCLLIAVGVIFTYVRGLDWVSNLRLEGIGFYLLLAFILSMSHEMLHALAWWYYGYFAIPIPIPIPPILGITIGSKPKTRWENFIIFMAPVLLSVVCFLLGYTTENKLYFVYGGFNLFGMVYDILHAFRS